MTAWLEPGRRMRRYRRLPFSSNSRLCAADQTDQAGPRSRLALAEPAFKHPPSRCTTRRRFERRGLWRGVASPTSRLPVIGRGSSVY